MIPHSAAMAWAVRAKSPVTCGFRQYVFGFCLEEVHTMKILMPALRKVSTTEGISSRGGSTMPTIPTNVKPVRA